jgi:hypothetical protein
VKDSKILGFFQQWLVNLAGMTTILAYVQPSARGARNDLRGWIDESVHAFGNGAWLPWLAVSIMILSAIVAVLREQIVSLLASWIASVAVVLPLGLMVAPAVAIDALGATDLYDVSGAAVGLAVVSGIIGRVFGGD